MGRKPWPIKAQTPCPGFSRPRCAARWHQEQGMSPWAFSRRPDWPSHTGMRPMMHAWDTIYGSAGIDGDGVCVVFVLTGDVRMGDWMVV